jgi:hypothetical protein
MNQIDQVTPQKLAEPTTKTSEPSTSESSFKTRRQTNRKIINSKLNKKIRGLSKKIERMNDRCKYTVVEVGESTDIEIAKGTANTIKIYTELKLKKTMKIVFSVKSNDTDPGGLTYYMCDFENDEDHFKVVIENRNADRLIKIGYVISE